MSALVVVLKGLLIILGLLVLFVPPSAQADQEVVLLHQTRDIWERSTTPGEEIFTVNIEVYVSNYIGLGAPRSELTYYFGDGINLMGDGQVIPRTTYDATNGTNFVLLKNLLEDPGEPSEIFVQLLHDNIFSNGTGAIGGGPGDRSNTTDYFGDHRGNDIQYFAVVIEFERYYDYELEATITETTVFIEV